MRLVNPAAYGTGPTKPPTLPPPPPPKNDGRPAGYRGHRRVPPPLWAHVVAGVGLTLATYAAGWVSCWAVAL